MQKKCEAKKNQRLKALISVRAKKFIPSQQFVINIYFKGTQQFTGCFPNHDWLCHPWPPFVSWPRVTKPIMVGKTPCKLLCAFEVNISNKLLARYKLLGPNWYQSFRSLIHSQISWPYLISELLVAGSSWPHTFFTPQVFLFSISLLFVNILLYS